MGKFFSYKIKSSCYWELFLKTKKYNLGLTSIKFTATQYALFSSLMLLLPKVLAGYSGTIVDQMGYANFYIFTAIIGIPVLLLIFWIARIAPIKE